MSRWLLALDSSSSFLRSLLVIFLSFGFIGNARANLYGTVWDLRGNFTVGSGDYIQMTGDGNGDSFKYQDGYFNHNASTMDFWGNAQIGLNNWAVFYQNGGDMNVGGYLSIARYGGSGYLEVNGGLVNAYNHQIIVGEQGTGDLRLNGGRAYSYQGVTLGQNGGSTGNLYLNGGTLEAGAIWKVGGTGNLSFNGGTLKATHDEWNFISGLNSANIGGNGAVIDNSGKGIGINQTLTGSGGLYLYGGGTTYLRQGNQYTGGTFINAGTLDLRGDQSYSSQYTIGNGARLNVTSDSTWFYNAPSFNFTSSGNGNITADSGNFIMSANTSYTTAGGARNLIDGSRGINLNGYTATFDVVRGTDANTDLTLSTVLWNSGGMVKNGNGIMKMSGVNSYSGETKVVAGTLMVDTGGSIATSSATVSSGAALKVNGVAGAVVLNGILSGNGSVGALTMNAGSSLNPGDAIGKLTASSASFAAGSTYNFGIASVTGAAGTAADLFSVTGALDLSAISSSSKMNLVLQSLSLVGFNVDSQYSWTLAEAGSITGAGWAAGTDVTDRFIITSTGFNAGTQPGRGFNVKTASEGGLVKLVLNAVPEPTTGSLFFMASMLWAMNRRRRS